MKLHFVNYVMLIALGLFLISCASGISPKPPATDQGFESSTKFVSVDLREPSFMVFTEIPKDAAEKELQMIRSGASNVKDVRILTWKQFTNSVGGYARALILRYDYPDFQVEDELLCLMEKQPGTPWALTWNGGIALTFKDYQFVRQRYARYMENPAEYSPIGDPREDPVNPDGFLQAFACR